MKKIGYLLSIAMMAAAGLFCACSSSDDDVAEATADETSTGNQYMAVTLTFANGSTTRADYGAAEYDATENEQAVDASTSYFLFYNSSGTCIATGTLASSASWTDSDSGGIDASTENLVTVSMEDGKSYSDISQVVVVLNCPSDVTLSTLKSYTLSNLSSYVVSGGLDGGSGDFIMSSAVLYSSSSLISGPAVEAKVYTTVSEAQASPTTIYVDRLAAKVTIATQGSSDTNNEGLVQAASGSDSPYAILSSTYPIQDYDETNSKAVLYQKAKVKVVIDGWGITGTNSNAYLIKNITVSDNAFTSGDVLAKAYSNSALSSGWYNSTTSQLHWAEDVNYSSSSSSTYGSSSSESNALSYVTYSKLTSCSTDASYYQENTVDYSGQSSTTYNCAGKTIITPALVLAAHLEIDYNSENSDTYTSLDYDDYTGGGDSSADLYFLNGYFYTVNGLKYEIIELLKAAGYTGASSATLSYSNISDATITISRISGTSYGYVTTATDLTLYKDGNEVSDVADAINTVLGYSSTSSSSDLKLYTAGKCYYAALIEHMGSSYSGITDSDNKHAETSGAVPIYGFVRNNHYDLTINKITGVGAAIDPSSEITTIPDEETYYYLDAEIRILAWRYASQSIDF